ncbi:formate hydrogenlyase, partial [Komagataeibacter sp. FXV3]|nr:formate hydrogenlyase [Komagataeibacter sp. FXV3]
VGGRARASLLLPGCPPSPAEVLDALIRWRMQGEDGLSA